MSEIPRTEIERVKRETDLEALVRESGVELERAGKELRGLCPFHNDTTPSLYVNPEKRVWNCRGACDAGGDAIAWVMRRDKVDFRRAAESLGAGLLPQKSLASRKEIEEEERPEVGPAEAKILQALVLRYHESLKNSPQALRYLSDRGFANGESFRDLMIGYSDGTLLRSLPDRSASGDAGTREFLESCGFLRRTGYEFFQGCVVFPEYDENGIPVGMYGRRANDRRNRHLFLPGKRRGIFNRRALEAGEIILCEAHLDALAFHAHGLLNATCSGGTNGLSDELFDAIIRRDVRRIYIAFDRDSAGDASAERLAERFLGKGIACNRVKFPMGMDAAEFARKSENAGEELRELLVKSESMGAESAEMASFSAAFPPVDSSPGNESRVELAGDEATIRRGDRKYRIRGLFRNASEHVLKINIRVGRGDDFHVETLDLYDVKKRDAFIRRAAEELGADEELIKYDAGKVLNELEKLLREKMNAKLKKEEEIEPPPERKEAALAYARSPELWKRIVLDAEEAGLAGERVNFLTAYLASISRKTKNPLAVIIQSSSSAGKSTLMEAVLKFAPDEDLVKYTFMTGQSLYYMQSKNLKRKILAIAEDEGAERALYAIKLLQSEGRISIITTVKDQTTGLPDAREFEVEGPVTIFITSTGAEIDEELQNRSLILTVNEEREQTRLIQKLQREAATIEGIVKRRTSESKTELHRDFQRILRPLEVSIPYADRIEFPDARIRTRRDHEKFLTLIRSIALLNQHQREIRSKTDATGESFDYAEATPEDAYLARFLSGRAFGISLDELAPQTRRLLEKIEEMVASECDRLGIESRDFRFTRRAVREYTGWKDTQLKLHIKRLEDLEYLLTHGGGGVQGRLIEYELLYNGEGKSGESFILGLRSPDASAEAAFERELLNFFN